jgi:hypothetical protein
VRHVRALRGLLQSYAAAAAETQRLRKLELPDDDEFFECNPTPFVARCAARRDAPSNHLRRETPSPLEPVILSLRLHIFESAEFSFAHRGSVVSLRADDVSVGPAHLAVSRLKLTDGAASCSSPFVRFDRVICASSQRII